MSVIPVPNKEEIRDFLRQMGSLDIRLIQNRPNLGNNAVAQLRFVEARCVAGEPDVSEYAKGQAAAGVIGETITEMQEGPTSESRLGYLLAEHCVKPTFRT